jgi:hypothetical protein
MTNEDIQNNITLLHTELDARLAAGDRESMMKSIAILNSTWPGLFRIDDGIRVVYFLLRIWMDEMVRGEPSVLADVHSVSEAMEKDRLIRHCFWRLENDFPAEFCLEALQNIAPRSFSDTAFRQYLDGVEDSGKVTARIAELSKGNA